MCVRENRQRRMREHESACRHVKGQLVGVSTLTPVIPGTRLSSSDFSTGTIATETSLGLTLWMVSSLPPPSHIWQQQISFNFWSQKNAFKDKEKINEKKSYRSSKLSNRKWIDMHCEWGLSTFRIVMTILHLL